VTLWIRQPGDVDDRLADLAHLFSSCREAFYLTGEHFRWEPGVGSVAERAARKLPSPDPAIDSPVGESGHRLIADVVQTHLLTASGHLGGLSCLYVSGEVAFSPPALIRAIMENCARAMWVLGEDPDESAENRLARAYLEESVSAGHEKTNAGLMRGKTHTSYVEAKKHYDALRAEIVARFPGTDAAELEARTLAGQKWDGPELTVKQMYAVIERMGGRLSANAGRGVYGDLSSMTHPTLYPVRKRRASSDDTGAGPVVAHMAVDIPARENEARMALAAFYICLTYVTDYFGWSDAVLDDLTEAIQDAMPTFFPPDEEL